MSLQRHIILFFLATLLALLYPVALADELLDNTCPFGNNYIQLAGFACNVSQMPSGYDGRWGAQGGYNIMAFKKINQKLNELGISIGGTTYCSNFTVRTSPNERFKNSELRFPICDDISPYLDTISPNDTTHGQFTISLFGAQLTYCPILHFSI